MDRFDCMTVMSFEQYAAWCAAQARGYREETPESIATAATEAPTSYESAPVTLRSNNHGVVVTPFVKGSR